jgi:hypothetical protein
VSARKKRAPGKRKSDVKSAPAATAAATGTAPLVAADGAPLVVPAHGNGLLKQGGDHDRPGRPPNAVRLLAAQLLRDKLLPRAAEVIGRSKDGDLHLRAIEKFSEVAHNEKMRLAKLAAGGVIAGRQGSGPVAAVQVHVSGGPTGVERAATEVHPPT